MAIDYRILKSQGLIAVTVSGRISVAAVQDMVGRLSNDPDFVWNSDRIVFIKQDADFSDMSFELFHEAIDAMKKTFLAGKELPPSELPAYRAAVVCAPTINEVVMRLFSAVWKTDTNPFVAIEHFNEISDALAWLGRDSIPETEFHAELIGLGD